MAFKNKHSQQMEAWSEACECESFLCFAIAILNFNFTQSSVVPRPFISIQSICYLDPAKAADNVVIQNASMQHTFSIITSQIFLWPHGNFALMSKDKR